MDFGAIVGNRITVSQLQRAATARTLTHAVLLVGPEGVGKTSIAEALATLLLRADAWPGGLAAHPDHWLEDGETERVGIDRVRGGSREAAGLQSFLSLRPFAGGHRVAVIARAERLTEQAANSLLKSIEEPPPNTTIVLCAGFPERLPATVRSRCQQWVCQPVPARDITPWLEQQHGVAHDVAAIAAPLAGGRPGRALRLATEPGLLGEDVEALDRFLSAAGRGRSGALAVAGALAPGAGADGRDAAQRHLAMWSAFLRDVACIASGAPELVVWTAYRPALEAWAAALPLARVVGILDRLAAAAEQLAANAQPRLLYERLFLDLFTRTPSPPLLAAGDRGGLDLPALLREPREAKPKAAAGARGPRSAAGRRSARGAA